MKRWVSLVVLTGLVLTAGVSPALGQSTVSVNPLITGRSPIAYDAGSSATLPTGSSWRVAMSDPVVTVPSPGAAGSLAAGVYTVGLVAVDLQGNLSAVGPTSTCTTVAVGTGSCSEAYTAVTGAVSYRLYYGAVGSTTLDRYIASTATPAVITTTTIGGAVISGTAPTTNSAYRLCIGGACGTSNWLGLPLALPKGTATAVALGFYGDSSTGIYSPTANYIGFAAGGAQIVTIRFDTTKALNLVSAALLGWNEDTYVARVSDGVLKLYGTTAGELRVTGDGSTGTKYLSLKHDGTNALLMASSGDLQLSGSAGFSSNYWAVNPSGNLLGVRSPNILWNTDGGGSIGSIGANRPDTIYAKSAVISGGSLQSNPGSLIGDSSRGGFYMSADGVMRLSNSALTGFTRLNFGGTTSSFPSFQVSGTTITLGLADGTAGGLFSAPGIIFGTGNPSVEGSVRVNCTGTSPARVCSVLIYDGGAVRTVASFTY